MAKLVEVTDDAFGTVKVAYSRSCTETGQGHDSCANVNSPQGYCPLHGANEGLVLLDVIEIKEGTSVKLGIVAFLQRGGVLFGSGTEHGFKGGYHAINVFPWGLVKGAFVVTEEVTSEVECHRT